MLLAAAMAVAASAGACAHSQEEQAARAAKGPVLFEQQGRSLQGDGFSIFRWLRGEPGRDLREQEEALARSVALWPGVLGARVHMSRRHLHRSWSDRPRDAPRAAVVVQPRLGAVPGDLPGDDELRSLVAVGLPGIEAAQVQVLWTPPVSNPGQERPTAKAGGSLGVGEAVVGPFRVLESSALPLRLMLALLSGLVVLLSFLVLRKRRVGSGR